MNRRPALCALLLCLALGCRSQSQPAVAVFTAASTGDVLEEIARDFETETGVKVTVNPAASSTLAVQIEQGAGADVFASADMTNMDRLKADGFTSGTPQVFAHNKLEIVVAPGNPKHITSLADLARPDVIYISAGPTVPAGKYAQQALQKAGVTATPRSLETDVKSVVSKIELGEADAGIVYATDVKAAAGKIDGVQIPDADNVVATYPLTAVKDSKNASVADQFIAYVLSSAGQAKLNSFGFLRA